MKIAARISLGALPVLMTASSALAQVAHVADIKARTRDSTLDLLILLDTQPTSAWAEMVDGALVVRTGGLKLSQLDLAPPRASGVTRVTIAAAMPDAIAVSGPKVSSAQITLYRKAIFVSAQTVGLQPLIDRQNAAPTSIAALPAPAPATSSLSFAAAAGYTTETCFTLSKTFAADPWNIEAMGAVALCSADAGQLDKVEKLEKQLTAIAPADWRAPLARAALARRAGDASRVAIELAAAKQLAPAEASAALVAFAKSMDSQPPKSAPPRPKHPPKPRAQPVAAKPSEKTGSNANEAEKHLPDGRSRGVGGDG